MVKSRDYYYDNLKFILIFLVVLGHFFDQAEGSTIVSFGRYIIYIFHMPMFVLISGLFFEADNIKKSAKKFCGFILLFLVMEISYWGIKLLLFQETDLDLFSIGGMTWYVFALAVWCLLTPFVLKFVNHRIIFIVSVLLALIIGYDPHINWYFALSRIIVFYPFFLAGVFLDKDKVKAFVKKKWGFVLGIIIFVSGMVVIWKNFDQFMVIKPMLSGQNPYYLLNDYVDYGFYYRAFTYLMSLLFGISFMTFVPARKMFFTRFGERTISIYFYDQFICAITALALTNLFVWQYVVLAIGLTFLFSIPVFDKPIRAIITVPKSIC